MITKRRFAEGPANTKQKQLIHILKAQLMKTGVIDEDGYRAMLSRLFDVSSSKELTYNQASDFIDELKKLGAVIVPKGKQKPDRWKKKEVYEFESSKKGLIEEIRHYAAKRYGAEYDTPLRVLAKRMFDVDRYEWLSAYRLKHLKQALLNLEAGGTYQQYKRRKEEEPF